MNPARISYRTRQFWQYLGAKAAQPDLAKARAILTPRQMGLLTRMQTAEQIHSLEVLRGLEEAGETDPNLLTAALLHDAGKVLQPLHIWERVWVVLTKAILPGKAKTWGEADRRLTKTTLQDAVGLDSLPAGLPWWKRPFVTADQHPAWGAELAAEAGSSPTTVALIHRHQEKLANAPVTREDVLLLKLQAVDDQS